VQLVAVETRSIAASNSALTEQAKLLELVVSNQSIHPLLDAIVRFVEKSAPEMRCAIMLADSTSHTLRNGAAPNLPPDYTRAIDGIRIADGNGSCGTAAARREIVIVSDIATSELWEQYSELAAAHGLAACWSVPLLNDKQELLGTCAMYYERPRAPTQEQMDLIRVAGSLASIAIQRYRDNERLLASELRHRHLIDACPDGILAHVDGRLLYANEVAMTLLKISAVDLQHGMHLIDFKLPGFRNDLQEHRSGVLNTHMRTANGEVVFVEALAKSTRIDGQDSTMLMFRDTTLRHSLENELLDAANREQQHLAFDLHDGLGQQLTGISLLLGSIKSRVHSKSPEVAADFDLISDLVSKSISDTRLLAGTMSPVTVERAGITGALQTLRDKAESIYKLQASLSFEDWPNLKIDPFIANHIYRIVQEAVGNVARHANATRVSIDARGVGANLSITVTDDGAGLPDSLAGSTGLGLRSMRYRAERIGGSIQIETCAPHGTQIRLLCPVKGVSRS
jgi:signal transduction histidine kinase